METRLRLDRKTAASIDNCLRCLRAEIVRDGKPGLEHVAALMRLRGMPTNEPVPRRINRRFKRGRRKALVLAELRSGPLTCREIADRVRQRHGMMTAEAAYDGVHNVLRRLEAAGHVVRDGRLWVIVAGPREAGLPVGIVRPDP